MKSKIRQRLKEKIYYEHMLMQSYYERQRIKRIGGAKVVYRNQAELDQLSADRRRQLTRNERSPQDWLDLLAPIPMPLQKEVACIVWWDHFSDTADGGESLAIFGDWVNDMTRHDIPSGDIVQALHDIGYGAREAWSRVTGGAQRHAGTADWLYHEVREFHNQTNGWKPKTKGKE